MAPRIGATSCAAIGNLFLLVLNLPLIGLWVRKISVPYHLLFPAILVFCAINVFSLASTQFDVYPMGLLGVLGYFFRKLDCEAAPMMLGFILGPMMEEYLRRALLISPRSRPTRGGISTGRRRCATSSPPRTDPRPRRPFLLSNWEQ